MKLPAGNLKPTPHKIQYPRVIEECIELLTPTISEKLPKGKKYLTRWLCLKLIDGDPKILASLSKNLDFSLLDNSEINLKLIAIKAKLSNENIQNTDNFRDQIVSSIVFEAETLTSDACTFEKDAYNEKDRKIDKILTSKKFGIPIMVAFLGLIFWITIIGANYPSSLLSNLFSWIKEGFLFLLNYIHFP